MLSRILTFRNVVKWFRRAFRTSEALGAIASTTIENLSALEWDGTAPEANRIPGLES